MRVGYHAGVNGTRFSALAARALFLVAATLVALPPTALAARRNDPNIQLDFRPQQTVAAAEAVIYGAMLEKPARLRLEDGRTAEDKSLIGTRTNDDDRVFKLKAVGEDAVMEHVKDVLTESAASWGVQIAAGAPRELEVRLLVFRIVETNQVVGATYKAQVRLAYSISRPGGEPRMSGTAEGDATRYGRKFSDANINEVQSDALLEAIANMLSDPALQNAWED